VLRISWLLASVVLSTGQTVSAAPLSSAELDELASAKGCYLCHHAEPVKRKLDDSPSLAPSWKDIALRYRGQESAESRLTDIVLAGSGNYGKDRHWMGKVGEVGMLPNVKEIDEDQARQLVHWILSFAP
jgi:cytochrome c